MYAGKMQNPNDGCIYWLALSESGPVKIGFSHRQLVTRRMEDAYLADLDRRTTVIMLGDGRSNYANPRLDIMRDIELRSRAVIWLNPEPESYWGSGDSEMPRYRRFCHVAKTCNTLKQLERIIDDVLRTYVPK